MKVICFILAIHAVQAACISVSGDRIHAADIVAQFPQFAAVAPEETLGYAPMPGAQRVIAGAELSRIAAKAGVQVPEGSQVCFERQTETLTPERVIAAIREGLQDESMQVELVDFSRFNVPPGKLEFPRSSLNAAAVATNVAALWRGRVVYDGSRSMAVWARVKLSVETTQVVAATRIASGQVIGPEQIRVDKVRTAPFGAPVAGKSSDVVGRVARISLRAGQPIPLSMLTTRSDVNRGDALQITVVAPATRLVFMAQAESAGTTGQSVTVRNPWTKHEFRAVVEGPGKGKVEVR